MTAPLYDLGPALRVMLLGVVVALGPLAWVWVRNKHASPARRLGALALLTLFLTFDLVLFGAFTRLTDSGLGCPDWPGCYGTAGPIAAHAQISQAQAAMPTGPVTHDKAWVEMIHRYLATGVGVLITTLALSTWLLRRRGAVTQAPWLPWVTLAWVCLQGAFGALTVTMKLFPAIVTMHLLGGLVLLALLTVQAAASGRATGRAPVAVDGATRGLLLGAFALVALQVALGGWVSTNYAVLACNSFPACQGSWWPPMDFRQGFELWRGLGLTAGGEQIGFAALTAIHYTHRLGAYLVFAVLAVLALRLQRVPALHSQRNWLLGLMLWQFATGVTNVVLDWPLAAAVAHTGGAAALVVLLTWTLCQARPMRETSAASQLHPSRASA
ncbi:heme A synthase [Caenimonas terrae]|uniref:Heme A synthase n=1 Tax=Caenimonas terrae TaxID=696074 RepID=A0ABW0N7V7_9BURK